MPGSTSDNEITIQSGVLDQVVPGRGVITDRGFTIQDTCEEKGRYHFAPPMLEEEQFSITPRTKTFDIAHLRIHVERFIGKMRNWHILSQVWPLNQYDLQYLIPLGKSLAFLSTWAHSLVLKYSRLRNGGDVHDVSNYRPISLLSIVSKLLERVIHIHVSEFIKPSLSDFQHGFRKKNDLAPLNFSVFFMTLAKL